MPAKQILDLNKLGFDQIFRKKRSVRRKTFGAIFLSTDSHGFYRPILTVFIDRFSRFFIDRISRFFIDLSGNGPQPSAMHISPTCPEAG
jgi:hypothetical protein